MPVDSLSRCSPRSTGTARRPWLLLLLALLALPSLPSAAWAQTLHPNLSLDRFQAISGPGRILALPTSRTMGLWAWSLDLALDYARGPLATVAGAKLVSDQVSGQLVAAVGLRWAEVGLALPVTLYQVGDPGTAELLPGPLSSAALGDIRLWGKARLTPESTLGGLGFDVQASFPTGNGSAWSGEDGYGFAGRLIGDVMLGERVQLALNVGYRYRSVPAQISNLFVSDELLAGLGLSVHVVPGRLSLFGVAQGSFAVRAHDVADGAGTRSRQPTAGERPLEVLLGGTLSTDVGMSISLAGGTGVGTSFTGGEARRGYGSPDFRVVAMIGFCTEVVDSDGDGVPDYKDDCRAQPGPARPGERGKNGCPREIPPPPEAQSVDTDGDGVPDARDPCPRDPLISEDLGEGQSCSTATPAPTLTP